MYAAPLLTIASVCGLALAAPVVVDKRFDHSAISLASYPVASLRHPTSRVFNNQTVGVSPCGGAAQSATRTDFPLSGGKFSILTTDEAYFLQFGFSTLSSPTSDDQFSPLVTTLSGGDQLGHSCMLAPNFATEFNLTAGQEITIQLEYQGEGTNAKTYFSCADVRLVEPADYTWNGTCINASASASASTVSTKAVAKDDAVSKAAAGGIGAGVTVAVLSLLGLAAWFFGLVAFGSKKKQATAANATGHPAQTASVAGTDFASNSSGSLHKAYSKENKA